MIITTDILFDIMKTRYKLLRYGCGLGNHKLYFPTFYTGREALRNDGVYVLRTQELPSSPDEDCLYICVGQRPRSFMANYPGEIFFVSDPGVDLFEIFNFTQQIFERLSLWESGLESLLNEGADIREMVRISIPVFNNRIIVIDYELRTIAYCESTEKDGHKEIRMSDNYERIPESKSRIFMDSYLSMRDIRQPYRYNDNEDESYCINLYIGDSYAGVCSLTEDVHSFRDSDFELFQILSDYIRRAMSVQSRNPGGRFVTLKTIFTQLLDCMPVSNRDVEIAVEEMKSRSETAPLQFVCIAIRSANREKALPGKYLCSTIENLIAGCTAIEYEKSIVVFFSCETEILSASLHSLSEKLQPYLSDMNFRAGFSEPFSDLFKSRTYYLQAVCALDTGMKYSPGEYIFHFSDYALYYMLEHCCGDFEPAQLIPDGLIELSKLGRGTSYLEILKCYLDNECNASRTAAAMYLHRSSLMPKLEKIKSYVDLSTPEKRLYMRLCLYLDTDMP